jgi:hypothetical protein
MLSERGQAFLQMHKRRRSVSDLDFIGRLFTKLGVSPVEELLAFQETFGGYVSPTRSGQRVWQLTTSSIPEVFAHDGIWLTPCSDDGADGPRIDTKGHVYAKAHNRVPVASSYFMLFEQMAFISEWEASQSSTSTPLVARAC